MSEEKMSLKTNFEFRSIILSTKFSEGLKKSPKENMSEEKKLETRD